MIAVRCAEDTRPVPLERLYLDHIGAVLREQHGAVGAGDALREIDDFDAFVRLFITHGLALLGWVLCPGLYSSP